MIEAIYAQTRLAASILFARPFHRPSLSRLVDSLLETRQTYGSVDSAARQIINGPDLDEKTARAMQLRRFRTQAQRATRETPYYAGLFDRLGLNPKRLTWDDIQTLPRTNKAAVRDRADAFIRDGQQPTLLTRSTGTTGQAAFTVFTRHEMEAYALLGALTYLLQGTITGRDIVQVSTSARAVLGNTVFMNACQRVGALVYQTGLVEPEQALAQLTKGHAVAGRNPRSSFLLTYPSYLAKLTQTGLQQGYGPTDFGLQRIGLGGEIVTEAVRQRSRALFGDVSFQESYALTEAWPINGQVCEQGHLHFEPTAGLVEVIDPDSGRPTRPGEIGSLVLTPFAPYRESVVVLRYDSQDLVRELDAPPTCSLKRCPATGNLLGKQRLSVRHDRGWTCPRDVVEALETLSDLPLPVRCGFWAQADGVAVEVAVPEVDARTTSQIEAVLLAYDIPLRALHLTANAAQLTHPLPWRGDLHERSFDRRVGSPTIHHAGVIGR
jgi:phenylacetate-coenzyme A ligase PaaK-like adenylate-forming protein